MSTPRVSFVLATHNRCDVVLDTLDQVARCGLQRSDFETIVVDNDSNDGTCERLRARPDVRRVELRRNAGPCAKTMALPLVRGEFTVFLDDDSFPRPGSVERMIAHMERDERLGAAGFLAYLPDGSQECSALPHVFIGCGVGLRTSALRAVGGLDPSFFMAAEEYDLAFRLMHAGWRCDTFGDLSVTHLKTPGGRTSHRVLRLDARNNLRLIARYLAPAAAAVYTADWRQRYGWLAQAGGRPAAFWRGWAEGIARGAVERWTHRRLRLSPETFEQFFRWEHVERRMRKLWTAGVRRVTLIDLGKNIYPYWSGARSAGLRICAIGDDRFTRPGRRYRGVPIVPLAEALRAPSDALVISNMSFVHAARRQGDLSARTRAPVFNWFPSPESTNETGCGRTEPQAERTPAGRGHHAALS